MRNEQNENTTYPEEVSAEVLTQAQGDSEEEQYPLP